VILVPRHLPVEVSTMPKFGRLQKRFAAAAAPRQGRRPQPSANGPMQLRSNIELRHQFRFASTNGAPTAVTSSTLSGALGVVAVTAVLGVQIAQSFKVNQIEIWTPPASQGASATCSVLFPQTASDVAREYSDTTVSVATPAHVVCSPPQRSLASFWQSSAGVALFTLVAPPGSVIDVWVSYVLADPTAFSGGGAPATLVGATIGNTYYTALDSLTSAGAVYKPIALSTL